MLESVFNISDMFAVANLFYVTLPHTPTCAQQCKLMCIDADVCCIMLLWCHEQPSNLHTISAVQNSTDADLTQMVC